MDQTPEKTTQKDAPGKKQKRGLTPLHVVGRILFVLFMFVTVTFVGAYITVWTICCGPSPSARDIFVTTMLETGQMKFLPSLFLSHDEILEITSRNGRAHSDATVDTGLIAPIKPADGNDPGGSGGGDQPLDPDGIELVEISGRSFFAKMLIINDPSRVRMATIYPWSSMSKEKNGQTLEQIVTGGGYLAGVNGGLYYSQGNWGGRPMGMVVSYGELQYNDPRKGDVLVGFNEDNILLIIDVGDLGAKQAKALVEEQRIRDAICFKDVDDGDDNHFTKLIVNGEPRQFSGTGSGANPRTVIGQRADGAVLLLVTDGRGAAGHLGATVQDLISIMLEYGAVNAANLDGGSSSAMYYDGKYEMTSVTLYYSTSSWRLPTAFVVERRED